MKNLIYLFAPAIILLSCKKTGTVENVENTVQQQTYILPKTIVQTDANGTNIGTATFSYIGNKMVEYVGLTSKVAYTYTGNLVTKITTTNSAPFLFMSTEDYSYNTDSTLNSLVTYTEENSSGQLVKSKSIVRYTYNANGTVSQRNYSIDINTGAETPGSFSILNTFTNGNISKKNNVHYTDSNTSEQTLEYDTKNSPYENVLGYNRLFKERSNTNNLLKQTIVYTTYFNGQAIITSDVFTRAYVYNNDNFPTEIKYFSTTGVLTGTIQFTY
jgi:hypothetical protein